MRQFLLVMALLSARACAPCAALADDDIPALIKQLDSDGFAAREKATEALINIGEPARAVIEEALKKSDSAEVKARAARVLKQFDLERIQHDAFKLEDLLAELKGADQKDWESAKLRAHLEQLMRKLSDATGRKCKLPLRIADLHRAAPGTHVKNQFVIVRDEQVEHAHDSVILLMGAGNVAYATNCVIISRLAMNVGFVHNCVVVARLHVDLGHADGSANPDKPVREGEFSIVLSGGTASIAHATHTIVAAPGGTTISHVNGDACFINTKCDASHRSSRAKDIAAKGLVFELPKQHDPLTGKLSITSIWVGDNRGVVLFRRAKGDGEYVLRPRQEFRFPSGEKMPEFAGWTMTYLSADTMILQNGDQVSIHKWNGDQ